MASTAEHAATLLDLLRRRARLLGMEVPSDSKLEQYSSTDFSSALKRTDSAARRVELGLVWPMVLANKAIKNDSGRNLDDALFRLGHHLRECAGNADSVPERRALSRAGIAVFQTTEEPPSAALAHLVSLAPGKSSEQEWSQYVGFTERDLTHLTARAADQRRARKQRLSARSATPHSRTFALPDWLTLPPATSAQNRSILSTANWSTVPTSEIAPEVVDQHLARGYAEYVEGRYEAALAELDPVLQTAGTLWAPSEAPASTRLWNWLRLVVVLSRLEARRSVYRHLDLLTGTVLASRLDAGEVGHRLMSELLESTRLDQSSFSRTPLITRMRLLGALGREQALADLTNADKAEFRRHCARALPRANLNTDASTYEVELALRDHTRELEEAIRQALPALDQLSNDAPVALMSICDEQERRLIQDFLRVKSEFDDLRAASHIDVDDMESFALRSRELETEIRNNGSLLLQELLLPYLDFGRAWIEGEQESISRGPKPEIEFRPETHTVPAVGSHLQKYGLAFWLRNSGNSNARNITFRTSGVNFQVDVDPAFTHQERIRPGGEEFFSVRLSSSQAIDADYLELSFEVSWRDEYGQSFSSEGLWRLEAERDAGWQSVEPNPFSLNSISDPSRLVGREALVESLESTCLSGESVYITGMKRVGKSSLVRVVQQLIEDDRTAVVYFVLGFAGLESGYDLIRSIVHYLDDELKLHFDVPSSRIEDGNDRNLVQTAGSWLRSVGRALEPGQRCVLAIDDFDELPPAFFKGEDADNLFRFIRGLADESWLSLVLVGSEVLPSIIAEQSHRINQVSPVPVEHFSSTEAIGELLIAPSSHRLVWDPSAVARVFAYSAGNPYYATILARQVWDRMRSQRRSVVQAFDVEDAAGVIANDSEESQFVHLWADDPGGIEPSSRRALLSSALLRGLAHAIPGPFGSASAQEVTRIAQGWIVDATSQELGDYLDRLVNRGVVQFGEHQQLSFAIPLSGLWFKSGGAKKLDARYQRASLTQVQKYVISSADYALLAHDIVYCGRDLTTTDAEAWVQQVGQEPRQKYLAMQLLRRALEEGYISMARVQREHLPKLKESFFKHESGMVEMKSGNYTNNVVVVAPDGLSSSAGALVGPLSKSFRIPKKDVVAPSDLADRVGADGHYVLVVADDFVGTGRQLSGRLSAIRESLSEVPESDERISLVVLVAVAADEQRVHDVVAEAGGRAHVAMAAGPRLRAFDESASIFDSKEDRQDAMDLFRAIGSSLGSPEPLGFGNQGLLVVFEHNCPNNSLPALWKDGTFQGRRWIPLFSRRR